MRAADAYVPFTPYVPFAGSPDSQGGAASDAGLSSPPGSVPSGLFVSAAELKQLKLSMQQMKERADANERENQALQEQLKSIENIAHERQAQLEELQKGRAHRTRTPLVAGQDQENSGDAARCGSKGGRVGSGLAARSMHIETATEREEQPPKEREAQDLGGLLGEFRRLRAARSDGSRQKVWPSDAPKEM
jgi:small-conductance mechanosensitive channel